jgi:hypothetical protein
MLNKILLIAIIIRSFNHISDWCKTGTKLLLFHDDIVHEAQTVVKIEEKSRTIVMVLISVLARKHEFHGLPKYHFSINHPFEFEFSLYHQLRILPRFTSTFCSTFRHPITVVFHLTCPTHLNLP